jgi:transcriptional regulator with XRE-family HTH domain
MVDARAAAAPAGGQSLLVDVLLRAARHRGDVSQREMADRAGVNRSVVARIEAGLVARPGFPLMVRLLAAAGCRLVVVDSEGAPLQPRPYEDALDAGLRHWPAHLDVREVHTESDWWYGMFLTDMRPLPEFTTSQRRIRNFRRWMAGGDSGNTPPGREVTDAGELDG